jgi:hypothetical protein
LKRASTRFWLCGSALVILASLSGASGTQTPQTTGLLPRKNELTLAGLRPGRDGVKKALGFYKKPDTGKKGASPYSWEQGCRKETLHVAADSRGTIEEVRVEFHENVVVMDCVPEERSSWRTGRNLAATDAVSRVIKLYGEPDSRSPSTKDGQRLELLYYAFDWAGSGVPQVMEVLCTVAQDGKPGRVVEIMLAASSL